MASQVLYSLAAEQGSGINGTVEIRQAESTDTSHIKLQARVVITWVAGYQRDYNALLEIKKNAFSNNDEDKYLNYTFEINKTYESGGMQTAWMDLKSNGSDLQAQSSPTVWVHFCPNTNAGTPTHSYSENSVVLTGIKLPYTLTTNPGAGSSISVVRQGTSVASTGTITSGRIIYKDDSLKISAVPNQNYGITGLTVNGAAFVSGNSHTVSGNVSVVSTAQVLASDVGATDANIESASTITIARYSSSYVHSLQYSFGNLNGYITAAGGTSSSEVKISGTSVAFTVPSTFYNQIPNASSGICTITCRTYASSSSTTVLGTPTTCTFTARASSSLCSPTVSGTVVDTNQTTISLTGDSSKLVRYLSTALCTISATARNGASIVSKSISGATVTGNTITISGDALTQRTIRFSATDSRGFTSNKDVAINLIAYTKLTCNPEVSRTTPTGGGVSLNLTGMLFNGAWRSGVNNTLTIKYRYRLSTASAFSDGWRTISSSDINQQSSGYSTPSPIALLDSEGSTTGFDYQNSYVFEFEAKDGDGTTDCMTITKQVTIQSGMPIFDWGENDFRFNVPIYIGKTRLTEAQLIKLIDLISGGGTPPWADGDVPDYVKTEALAVANKVKQVQTSKTITSIVWSDAHHTAEQVTGWQAQTNISTLHAAMGMAAIAKAVPIDFAAYCGDYTFGNGDTTLDLFRGQCEEMNKYMDHAWNGIPALYCVGNHDTGEYYLRDNESGALYGAETVYELIGGRNDDGTTVMGSTTYGYCYRDLTAKKCRVICLNSVEGETEQGYTGSPFSNAQLLWFAQTLYSAGALEGWSIIVVCHYPLDYGSASAAGNILYQYVTGGSTTINGTTVSFANHNSAKFAAQYHGHTHCLKAAKLNRIQNQTGTEFDAWRLATPSGTFYRNNDYAGHPVYGIEFGEDQAYTKTANTAEDTAFVVNVYDPDNEVIHSFCYGAGYDRIVSIGNNSYHRITQNLTKTESSNTATYVQDNDPFTTTITPQGGYDLQSITVTMNNVDITSQVVTMNGASTTYRVTNNLTNVTSNNNASSASGSYTATLTPASGYTIQTVTITMGGVDITSTSYSSGTINIPNVTGDVVITAIAIANTNYTNQVPISTDSSGGVYNSTGYKDGYRINSSGAEASQGGFVVTGFIPFTTGQTIRLAGDGISFGEYGCMLYFYDATKAVSAKGGIDYSKIGNTTYGIWATESNTVFTFTPKSDYATGFIRISAKGSGANLIVTLDEEIDS